MKKFLLALLTVSLLLLVGCSSGIDSVGSNIPSGDDCAENLAYLQSGVDMYAESLGQYPTDVEQLLESKEGKGPFVEVIPECPTGNQYVIENGTVKEAPKQ